MFVKLIKDERVIERYERNVVKWVFSCAEKILEIHERSDISLNDMKKFLKDADKQLFIAVRDKKLTIEQLRARVLEKVKGVKYCCFDDLKGLFNAEEINEMEEAQRV